MAEIKDIGAIQEKWGRVTPQRTEDYKLGVRSPKRDWEKSSVAAKENHKAAMVEAAAKDSFGKGCTKAGTGRWQSKALAKGPARFAEGVMVGAPDYGSGFAPYQQVIASTQLPPRFPRRDPRNIMRVTAIAAALGKAKVGA
jgi:hypothetical protein